MKENTGNEKIDELSPEERIKKLEELVEQRKKSVEEEIKKLEELKKKSISEAIDSAKIKEEKEIQELRNEKILEEKIAESRQEEGGAPDGKNSGINYALLEKIKNENNVSFYEITKPEVYEKVVELYKKKKTSNLTDDEKRFVSNVSENVDKFMNMDIYMKEDKENKNYLTRTKTFLDKLLGV